LVRINNKETKQSVIQCTQEIKGMEQNFYAFLAAKYGDVSGADMGDVANK
jgi:hypothetical protein